VRSLRNVFYRRDIDTGGFVLLLADSCSLMEMKKHEQCYSSSIFKFNTLQGQNYATSRMKPTFASGPSTGLIHSGSILRVKTWPCCISSDNSTA